MILYKEAGLSVFPLHKDPRADCMLYRLLDEVPAQENESWPNGFAGGIIHRLDIPTSGFMLVARNLGALQSLRSGFAEGRWEKKYQFLTSKRVSWVTNRCTKPIAHHSRKKKMMIVQRGKNTPHRGKWYPANTSFQLVKRGPKDVDLWEATITTGVMHQIRVHAAFVGLSLCGDKLYGGGPQPEDFKVNFALHHLGIKKNDFPVLSPPDWWPTWTT